MSTKVLADKDANAAMADQQVFGKDVKSMEYHRQVLQSKIAQDDTYVPVRHDANQGTRLRERQPLTLYARSNKYISPSDNIMSPCTAKINALRNKHASKFVIPLLLLLVMASTDLSLVQSQAQVALRPSER